MTDAVGQRVAAETMEELQNQKLEFHLPSSLTLSQPECCKDCRTCWVGHPWQSQSRADPPGNTRQQQQSSRLRPRSRRDLAALGTLEVQRRYLLPPLPNEPWKISFKCNVAESLTESCLKMGKSTRYEVQQNKPKHFLESVWWNTKAHGKDLLTQNVM